MEKHWDELTAHLHDATILFLTGRHGSDDGSIGPQDEEVMKSQIQQVHSSNLVQLSNICM